MPRMLCPRSAGDDDKIPTGQTLRTAPLSIDRSNASASAARPSTRVGFDCGERECWRVRVERKYR
jgi:hypothetical protein